MRIPSPLKVGLFGIGLDTYWPQFPGLREALTSYQQKIGQQISKEEAIHLVDAGLVDSPEKAKEAASLFRREEVDLLFLYISTYALSSTVLPVVRETGVPVVVLNLQPVAQLDYASFNSLGDRGHMTGVWLEHCQACCAPEIASVFRRSGITFHLVSGYLQDASAWQEIREWIKAAQVVHALKNHRCGVMGHYYGGMLDVYGDMTRLASSFGTHFELLEICELADLHRSVPMDRIHSKLEEFRKTFSVSTLCAPEELERAARTSCALDDLVDIHRLGSLAYYYESTPGNPYQDLITSLIPGNTLLTGRNVPVAGECEVKNAHAMKIMDSLGTGGSFSEFYLADFVDDVVFLGHDGPAHFAIAEGPVGLVPLPVYHGKPGCGLSIQMSVRHGPATLLSVVETESGDVELLTAEGASVPGPILEIGNTNSRYHFGIGAREFLNQWSEAGPAHHCAIGVGHHAATLKKLASILGLKYHRIV